MRPLEGQTALVTAATSFVLVAVSTILRDLALVCLILFFLRRNGEPVSVIGWKTRQLDRSIFLGLVLYLPLILVIGLVEQLCSAAGLSQPAVSAPALRRELRNHPSRRHGAIPSGPLRPLCQRPDIPILGFEHGSHLLRSRQ